MHALRPAALTLIILGCGPRLPPYTPHRLSAIPWPKDATTPQDRGSDYAEVLITLGGGRLRLARAATGWGTCIMSETYLLLGTDSLPSDGVQAGPGWLWSAPSYEEECRSDAVARDDSILFPWMAAGCLLIADDSLLAYAVIADTSREARQFVHQSTPVAGYYRYDSVRGRMTRVATFSEWARDQCVASLDRQHRDPRTRRPGCYASIYVDVTKEPRCRS